MKCPQVFLFGSYSVQTDVCEITEPQMRIEECKIICMRRRFFEQRSDFFKAQYCLCVG